MSEDDTVECWLVERTYDDKGMIRLVYAPPGGEEQHVVERAAAMGADATAAVEVDAEKLVPIAEEDAERYAQEADRMAERHEPDESV